MANVLYFAVAHALVVYFFSFNGACTSAFVLAGAASFASAVAQLTHDWFLRKFMIFLIVYFGMANVYMAINSLYNEDSNHRVLLVAALMSGVELVVAVEKTSMTRSPGLPVPIPAESPTPRKTRRTSNPGTPISPETVDRAESPTPRRTRRTTARARASTPEIPNPLWPVD